MPHNSVNYYSRRQTPLQAGLVVVGVAVVALLVACALCALRCAGSVYATFRCALRPSRARAPADLAWGGSGGSEGFPSRPRVHMFNPEVDWRSALFVALIMRHFIDCCQRNRVTPEGLERETGARLLCTLAGGDTVFGLAATRGDTLWIALRGAHTSRELRCMSKMSQGQALLPPAAQGGEGAALLLFHSGLLGMYERLRRDVRRLLTSAEMSRCARVVVGGYSMGAGLATLLALDIEDAYPGKCITFLMGNGRVSDPAMSRHVSRQLGDRVVRVVSDDDVFCSVPPVNWPGGDGKVAEYVHVGTVGLLFDAYQGNILQTHRFANYLDAIAQVAGASPP